MFRLPSVALFHPEARPATATGAVAIGALAVGAAAIGRLSVRERPSQS